MTRWLLTLAAWGILLAVPARAGTAVESFRYASEEEARAAWRAIDKSPPVTLSPDGGVGFPCPFDDGRDRVYWDRAVSLDLSSATRLEMELACEQPAALRSLALYLKSGDGWYIWSQPLPEAGRQHLSMAKSDFAIEGKPAGWDKIERLRFSPWKGSTLATRITAYSLTAERDDLYILPATLSAPTPAERTYSARVAERISGWLKHAGIPHALTSEEDFLNNPTNARLVVLPYNSKPPPALLAALQGVVERGGSLVVCFSESAELAALMQVELGEFVASKETGRFASMVFSAADDWHIPERVYQNSWNVWVAHPRPGKGRVIARWANANGEMQPEPAWIATSSGVWMTHVLLDDDRAGKERLLTGLLGHFDPGIWMSAARQAAASVGRIDEFPSFTAAVGGIRGQTENHLYADEIRTRLDAAVASQQAMTNHLAEGRYPEVTEAAAAINRQLSEAYSMVQPPRPDELRGVWDHEAVGWYPGDWGRTCRELKAGGLNAIFINALWAGLAHYPSEVVPTSGTNRRLGDQLAACLSAAHTNGLQVHAWKVCWLVENAPADFKQKLKEEGRLQQKADGSTVYWLNPALAANRELELAALEELARNYAVDGIHLDYIRYPDGGTCFAPASRQAFEAWRGQPVEDWPASVRSGAGQKEYQRWRAELITDFVREASQRIKAITPAIKISAAVWGGYPDTIPSIGQDWGTWLREGYVDFVCPMNYTEDAFRFSALVNKQVHLPGAAGKIFPGLGVTADESQLRPDEVVEQIAILRRAGARGFVLFDLSQTLRQEVLPVLREGVTR